MSRTYPDGTVMRVQWADSAMAAPGWHGDDYKWESADCVSVGFPLRHTKQSVVLAGSRNGLGEYAMLISIPVGAITRMDVLGPGAWPK